MTFGCSSKETLLNDFLANCLLVLSEELVLLKMDWLGDNSQLFSFKIEPWDCVRW